LAPSALRQHHSLIFEGWNAQDDEQSMPKISRQRSGLIFKGWTIKERSSRTFRLLKTRPLCCIDTSRTSYPLTQHDMPEEWTPQLKCCKNVKTCSHVMQHKLKW